VPLNVYRDVVVGALALAITLFDQSFTPPWREILRDDPFFLAGADMVGRGPNKEGSGMAKALLDCLLRRAGPAGGRPPSFFLLMYTCTVR
jgi:hypothetical protein